MADEKISTMTPATSIGASDLIPIVQSGTNKAATGDLIVRVQSPLPATPTTLNEVIALLQSYGICSMIMAAILFMAPSATAASFGDIPANLTLAAGQTARRNAGNSSFEAFLLSHSVTFVVDGSGTVLTTGTKNPIKIPFGGSLVGWVMMCSPSGSVTADVYRAADGAGLPVTSIVGGSGTKPAVSSNVENSSMSFTSWTSTTLAAKDNLAINLSGITTATYVELTLYFK